MKGILVFTAFAVVMFSAWLLSRVGLIGGTRTTILRDIRINVGRTGAVRVRRLKCSLNGPRAVG